LAKFENVWDEKPTYVNLGAQKNFAQYAKRIGQMWNKNADQFNEFYFKRVIARAVLFRKTERMVSVQPWYNGGYRANVVAYTLALLGELCSSNGKYLDFMKIWDKQDIPDTVTRSLEITTKFVHDDITKPIAGISNISEWCKKEACWDRLHPKTAELKSMLPTKFMEELVSEEEVKQEFKSAAKVQKMETGIEAQKRVFDIPASKWELIFTEGQKKRIFSDKEKSILQVAMMPHKIPSEKQSAVLLKVLEKAEEEGITV